MAQRSKIMLKEYGEKPGEFCKDCCNMQPVEEGSREQICIAYGKVDGSDCSWSEKFPACGLLNYPFHAIRPKRRPLAEVYAPKRRKKEDEDEQGEPVEKQFTFKDLLF